MNIFERTRQRIAAVEPHGEDKNVLDYIYKELAPSALAKREATEEPTVHLIEVANRRLKNYEKEATHS